MNSIRIGEINPASTNFGGAAVAAIATGASAGSAMRFRTEAYRQKSADSKNRFEIRRETLRRLRGFVVEDRGREFKVGFVAEGDPKKTLIQYYLPAELLRHAGVTQENQQFELDVVRSKCRDGSVAITHRVRACAPPHDSFVEPLELDPARQDKLSDILRILGNAEA